MPVNTFLEAAVAATLVHVVDEVDVPAAGRDLRVLDDVEQRHSPLHPRVWLCSIQVGPVAREPGPLLFGVVGVSSIGPVGILASTWAVGARSISAQMLIGTRSF